MSDVQEQRPLRLGAVYAGGPAASVTRRAADKLRAGHLWVYRTDVEQVHAGPEGERPAAGGLVTVLDGRGASLGTGLFSAASQIAVRMISRETGLSREAYLRELAERVDAALALRNEVAPATACGNGRRLLFSEADGLPGIVADQYGDLILLQLLTQGTAQDDVRAVLREKLSALAPATIAERPDPRIRGLEDLPPAPAEPLFANAEEPKLQTTFLLNGLRFAYDATAGQKTGAFLDQRLNYAAAADHAHGRALDVCTYQGGFALHMARVCERVTGVDASRSALEVADANLALNPEIEAAVDWVEADAFELMRAWEGAGERFDTIVLDPPAFAKSKRAAEGALRGYKELNLRALKMLRAGGTLVTCSCSHHVPLEEFTAVLAAAASDAGRRVQVLETRGAAPDHPAMVTLPETSYLKCLICRVD